MKVWKHLLILTLCVSFFSQGTADFLNDYLNDKTFGPDPGPCPNAANKCETNIDPDRLNPLVANINVCLLEDYCVGVRILGYCGFPNGFEVTACQPIKEWIEFGEVDVWNLQCNNVAVSSLNVEVEGEQTATELKTVFDANSFGADCTGRLDLKDVLFAYTIQDVPLFGDVDLGILVNGENDFSIDSTGTGSSLEFPVYWRGQDFFEFELPDDIEIPLDECDARLGLDISIPSVSDDNWDEVKVCFSRDDGEDCFFDISIFGAAFIGFLTNFVIDIVELTLNSILCDLISQSAKTLANEDGILNEKWDEFRDYIDEISAGVPDNVIALDENPLNFTDDEFPLLTSEKISNSMDFRNDSAVEIASVTLNSFLGESGSSGPLVINEVLDFLLGNDIGELEYNIAEEGYNVFNTLELNFVDVTLVLNSVKFQKLNTISTFRLLENNFEEGTDETQRLKSTLNHTIDFGEFVFFVVVDTTLARGEWVTVSSCGSIATSFDPTCTSDQEQFEFGFGLSMEEVHLNASTNTHINPSELEDVQLGQIFGIDYQEDTIDAAKQALKCVAPMFYSAYIPYFEISIGLVNNPETEIPFNSGLANLVRNSADIFTRLSRDVLREGAPGIAQGTARPEMNLFLRDEVALPDDINDCPTYSPTGDVYLNFSDGIAANIYPVINNVLGNLEPEDTDSNINDLIQVLLEYYSSTIDEFPIEPITELGVVTQGDWKTKPNFTQVFIVESFGSNGDEYIEAFNPQILDLNTIHALSASPFGPTDNGLALTFGFGDLSYDTNFPQLTLDWLFVTPIDSLYKNMNEEITTKLRLDAIEGSVVFDQILINQDKLFQLTFGQLQKTACLLSVLEGVEVVNSSLTSNQIFVAIDYENEPPSAGGNAFVAALKNISNATAPEATDQFSAMVNTILNNGFANILSKIGEFNNTITPQNCDTADNPLESVFSLFTGLEAPDITNTVAFCIADPVNPPLTPLQAEQEIIGLAGQPFFNFEDSEIVSSISGTFGNDEVDDNARQSVLKDVLLVLANESGTPLSDSFFIDNLDGEEVVTMHLVLNDSNWLFDLLGYDPLVYTDDTIIPDLNFQLTDLYVRGIDRFTANTKFLEVLSKFVTGYKFEFTKNDPLQVELYGVFESNGTFVGKPPTETVRESFESTIVIQGFVLDFELLTAINSLLFEQLTLGHFFAVTAGDQDFILADTAQDCLLSTIFENGILINRLNISIDLWEGPTFRTSQNIFSQEFEDFFDVVIKLLTDFYVPALPNIGQNCMRDLVNEDFRERWEQAQINSCPERSTSPPLPPQDQLLRFGNSKGIERWNEFLDENFIGSDPPFELWNKVIKAITRDNNEPVPLYTNGSFMGFEEFPLIYNGVNYGALTVKLTNLEIDNADTFDKLAIIKPVTDDNNFTTLDGFRVGTGDEDMVITFDLSVIALDTFVDYPTLTNDLQIEIIVRDLDIFAEVFAVINITEALDIRFSSVSSFNEIPCLLIPIDALVFNDFNFSTTNLEVTVKCLDLCEFPLFEAIEAGGTLSTTSDEDLSQLLDDAINYMIDFIEGSGGQDLINTAIETAPETCPYIIGSIIGALDFDVASDVNAALFMGYVGLGFIGLAGMSTMALIPFHKKRKKVAMKNFLGSKKTLSQDKEVQLFKTSMQSLFSHPRTPVVAKFLIPIVCLLNIFGLLVAIIFSGAINVIVTFVVFGAQTNDIVLVPFTIVSTINDLWNSGAYLLSLLIAVASCLWPVLKNMFLIIIWFSPTTILSKGKRNKMLLVMDILGKWSFLDVFVVVMTLAALRTYLRLSMYGRLSFVADNAFEVDVNVTPERGIILLCFIAASSLVANHVISWYHEKASFYDGDEEDKLRGILIETPKRAKQRKKMKDHQFAGIDKRGRRKVISKKAFRTLTFINFVSGLAVVIGVFVPLITFNLGGILGALLGQFDEELAVKTYSIFDLGSLVSESPTLTPGDRFVIIFFQALFFMVSLIAPVLQVGINYIIFAMPFSLKDQKVMLWLAYLASFWAALECFLVGIVMTIDQIDRITVYILDFISDSFCSNVQSLLEVALDDGACLTVDGQFEPLAPILFIGVVLQLAVCVISLQLAEAVIHDRYYQAYNGVRRETKPPKASRLKKFVMKQMTTSVRHKRGGRPNPAGVAGNQSVNLDQSMKLSPAPNGPIQSSPNPLFPGDSSNTSTFSVANNNVTIEDDIEV